MVVFEAAISHCKEAMVIVWVAIIIEEFGLLEDADIARCHHSCCCCCFTVVVAVVVSLLNQSINWRGLLLLLPLINQLLLLLPLINRLLLLPLVVCFGSRSIRSQHRCHWSELSVLLLLFRCCCNQRLLIKLLSSNANTDAPAIAGDRSTVIAAAIDPECHWWKWWQIVNRDEAIDQSFHCSATVSPSNAKNIRVPPLLRTESTALIAL